jgi:hypothetical protein
MKHLVVVPDKVDSFGYNCGPCLLHNFIQTDRPHVLPLRVASDLRCQLSDIAFDLFWSRAVDSDVRHMIIY